MAEGGGDFVGRDLIDFNNDDDGEQEVNRTQPFQPGAASTPYHGGEQIQNANDVARTERAAG